MSHHQSIGVDLANMYGTQPISVEVTQPVVQLTDDGAAVVIPKSMHGEVHLELPHR